MTIGIVKEFGGPENRVGGAKQATLSAGKEQLAVLLPKGFWVGSLAELGPNERAWEIAQDRGIINIMVFLR